MSRFVFDSLRARRVRAFAFATLLLGGACAGEVGDAELAPEPQDEGHGPAEPAQPDQFAKRFIRAKDPIPGQYIVVLRDDMGFIAADTDSLANTLAVSYAGQVKMTYTAALRGFVSQMSEEDALQLARDPMVAFVQEDGRVSINATQSGATWGIDRIDQRQRPISGTYVYNASGAGVSAYVIDTGIRITHSDFGGRAHAGYSSINDGNGSNDCNGHGTHVAGTVGGSTWGVAKDVQLYAVRVLDCAGSGSDSGVIAGVNWVTQNAQKPAVANMSLGGGVSTALDTAVKNSIASGVTYVLAAGNESADACGGSPSRVPEAITVGATGSSDARASYSNYGTCVDIFAPGSSIKSAWSTSNTATSTISGTSMASPHVAGAVALYLEEFPDAAPAAVASALIGESTTGVVTNPGSGSPNRLLYTGFIGDGTTPPTDPPTDPPTEAVELASGVAASVPATSTGQTRLYKINVPAGSTKLTVVSGSGSGDADIYVRFNQPPTTTANDGASEGSTSSESITINNPQTGTYYVLVNAWSAISGVSLTATVTGGSSGNVLQNGVPVTGLSGALGSTVVYTFTVPAGSSKATFKISGGSGDADLYVRFGTPPTTSQYDGRPYLDGNNETWSKTSPQAGTWYVMVRGYAAYSGVSLVASIP